MHSHDKVRQYKYHQVGGSSLSSAGVVCGSKVCLRSSPVYSAGGKAIHMKGTQLQCGVLQSSIINPTLSEKCSFMVISGREGEEGRGEVAKEGEGEKMDHETSEVDTVQIGDNNLCPLWKCYVVQEHLLLVDLTAMLVNNNSAC